MPPIAILGGAMAAGSVASGAMQASAAKDAAKMQGDAARDANQLQYSMFQQQRKDQDPWRQAGISAMYGTGGLFRRKDGGSGIATDAASLGAKKDAFVNNKLSQYQKEFESALSKAPDIGGMHDRARAEFNQKLGGFKSQAESEWNDSPEAQASISADQYEMDPELTRSFTNEDFVKDPGYDFRLQEGQKALERSAAARGGLQSGGMMKALSQYGQNFASNEYGNAYNRFNNDRSNRFNRLSAIAGVGQTATNQVGQAGQNYANQAGSNMTSAANAQGASRMAGAQAWGNAISGVANAGMGVYSGIQSQNNQDWMRKFLERQG